MVLTASYSHVISEQMRQTGGGSTESRCCSWSESPSDIPESLQYLQRLHGQQLSRCAFCLTRFIDSDSRPRRGLSQSPAGFSCSRHYLRSRPADLYVIALRIDGCFATSTWYSHSVLSWGTCFWKLDWSQMEELKGKSFKNHTFISLPKQTSPMNSKQSGVVSGIWKIQFMTKL